MTDFSKFQETECVTIEPILTASVCPDCKPSNSYIEPGMFEENRPNFYYNQKLCEYVVVFDADMTVSQIAEKYPDANSKLKAYLKDHKRGKGEYKDTNLVHGIRLLLANHSKMEVDRFICMMPKCADATPSDEINTEALELYSKAEIQVSPVLVDAPVIKVSIPKAQFEAVPAAPEEIDEDLATGEVEDGSNEIEFKTEEIYGKFLRLQWTLGVFQGFYKVFMAIDKGFLHFANKPNTPIYPSLLKTAKEDVKEFRKTLKDVIRDKGYIYGVFLDLPFTTRVERVKIKFDNSDPNSLYKVKSIHVKPEGCRWRIVHREKEGKRKFKVFGKDKININAYVADLYNVDDDIQASDPPSWHEFLVSHTYPQIKVNYADNVNNASNPESALGCAIDKWFNFGDILDNIAFTFEDIFELYAFAGKRRCDETLEDMKIDDEYWTHKEIGDSFRKAKKGIPNQHSPPFEIIKKKPSTASKDDAVPADSLPSGKEESSAANDLFNDAKEASQQEKLNKIDNRLKKFDDEIEKLTEKHKEAATRLREYKSSPVVDSDLLKKLEDKERRAEVKLWKKEAKKKEFLESNKAKRLNNRKEKIKQGNRKFVSKSILKAGKMRALQEFEEDDSVWRAMKAQLTGDFGEGNFPKGKEEWLKFISQISVCEFRFLGSHVLRCLLGGISFEKAMPKLMQSMMKTLAVRHLPKLLAGLPLEQQREVQKKVAEKIGEDPPEPWGKKFMGGEKTNSKISSEGANPDFEASEAKKSGRMDKKIEKSKASQQKAMQEHSLNTQLFNSAQERYQYLLNLPKEYEEYLEENFPTPGTPSSPDMEQYQEKLEDAGGYVTYCRSQKKKSEDDLKKLGIAWTGWGTAEEPYKYYAQEENGDPDTTSELIYDESAPTSGREIRQEDYRENQEERQAHRDQKDESWEAYKTERAAEKEESKARRKAIDKTFHTTSEGAETYGWSLNPDQREQSAFGGKVNDITEIILQAYVDAILETVEIDDLLKEMNKFPIVNLIKDILLPSLGYCPTKAPPFSLNIGDMLNGTKLSVCDPTFMITLPKLPKIKIVNIGKIVGQKLREALINIIVELIGQLIIKLLNLLEGVLCNALAALGNLGLNAILGNGTHFNDLVGNALCGTDDPEEVGAVLNDLLPSMGVGDPELSPDQVAGIGDCVGATIQSVTSKKEILNLFSGRDKDPRVIARITRAIQLVCPAVGETFDEGGCANIIDGVAGLIPVEEKIAWREIADTIPEDCPVIDSICLTSDEQEAWDRLRIEILEDFGLDPQEASEQIESMNEKTLEDLSTVADILTNGVDDLINNAVQDLFEDPDPGCFDPDKPSALPFDPSTLDEAGESAADFLFSQIEDMYRIEMTSRRNSVLNKILTDTEGNSYNKHQRRRRNLLTRTFYWDSLQQEQEFEDAGGLEFDWFTNRGYYPLTIGASLRHQTIEDSGTYASNLAVNPGEAYRYKKGFFDKKIEYQVNFLPVKNSDITLRWESSDEEPMVRETMLISQNTVLKDPDYIFPVPEEAREFKAEPKTIPASAVKLQENFDYSIYSKDIGPEEDIEEENFFVSVPGDVAEDTRDLIESLAVGDSSLPYRVKVFNKFIQSRIPDSSLILSDSALFDKVYSNIFKFTKNALISNLSNQDLNLKNLSLLESTEEANEVDREGVADVLTSFEGFAEESSEGFLFGNVTEALTLEDFEYVGPDGEEYNYKNREKVLGKAKGGNGRINYLNPEIHGGSYVRPKIYIKPMEPHGWSKIYKLFATPKMLCGEKTEDTLVGFGELKNRAKSLKNKISEDKRLYQDPECIAEIPFDKLLNKENHVLMDVLVRLIMRLYSLSVMIQVMPIVTNVHLGQGNFDSFLPRLILDLMKKDMMSRPRKNSWLKAGGYKYWYLFLEQACQVFYREVELGERTLTALEQDAVDKIKAAQAFYEFPDAYTIKNITGNRFLQIAAGTLGGASATVAIAGAGAVVGGVAGGVLAAQESAKHDITLLGREITLDDIVEKRLTTEEFYLYALAYREHQDAVFSSTSTLDLKIKNQTINRKRLQAAAKIFLIRIMEKEALVLTSSLMNKELGDFSRNFSEEINPTIFNFKKMMLSRSEMFKGSSLKLGTYAVEKERSLNAVIDPGDVADVVGDPRVDNPMASGDLEALMESFSSEEPSPEIAEIKEAGQFFIEKYIRVKDKETPGPQPSFRNAPLTRGGESDLQQNATAKALELRPEPLRGVVPIQSFKDFLGSIPNEELVPGKHNLISDFFGDLEFTYDEPNGEPTGVTGETGLSYGLRICYMPPASMSSRLSEISFDEEVVMREKSFKFPSISIAAGEDADSTTEMTQFVIPLASAEIGLIDEPLAQFISESSINKLDLECLVDKLITIPEFKLLFDNCFSLSSMNSHVTAHIYTCFLGSIGDVDGWAKAEMGEDPEEAFESWDGKILNRTKNALRRIFAGIYNSQDFEDEESSEDRKKWGELFKLMNPFRGLLNLGGLGLNRWAIRRIVFDNPFDEEGEECSVELRDLLK